MINEQENLVEQPQENDLPSNKIYIDAIKNYNENYVPKTRYEKLEEENRELVNALVNNEQITTVMTQENKQPIEELVKEMRVSPSKGFIFDTNFVEKALEFRERILEEQGVDCFVSSGHNVNPSQESYMSAQKTADIYRECLDYANGDNKVFINELQRRMVETNPFAGYGNRLNNNRR